MNKDTQIKEGYKETKFGRIPDNWKVVRVSDCFAFLSSTSFSRNDLYYEVDSESVFYIHYGDIHSTFNKTILDFEKGKNIPVLIHSDVKNGDTTFLQNGDLIIIDASEDYEGIGTCIEIRNIGNRKVISGLHTIAIRDIENITASGFRPYIFKNKHVSLALKKIATGSKVYGISKTNLSKLEIILPPIVEQQKIARILRTCDMAIETTEKLITKKRERKKGLMQQLLTGKRRFNEFISVGNESNQKLTGVPAGLKRLYNNKLPFGWNNSSLYTIAKVSYGISDPLNRTLTEGIKIISLPNVNKDGQFILAEVPLIEREKVTNEQILQVGDLLFNWRNGSKEHLGKTAFFNLIGDFTHVGFLLKIKVRKEKVEPFFLYSYINFIKQKGFFLRAKIQVNNTFNKEELNELPVIYPNIKEQLKIVTILQNADKEIETIQKQMAKLKEFKRGLMQVLLTGEKRVVYEQEV